MISIELSNGNLRLLLSTPEERKLLDKTVLVEGDARYRVYMPAIMDFITDHFYPRVVMMRNTFRAMMPKADCLAASPLLLCKLDDVDLPCDEALDEVTMTDDFASISKALRDTYHPINVHADLQQLRHAYEALFEAKTLVVSPKTEPVYVPRKVIRTDYGPMYLAEDRKLTNPFTHVWYSDWTFVNDLVTKGYCDFKRWY